MNKELKERLNKIEAEFDELMDKLNVYDVSPSEAYELAAKFLAGSYRVNKIVRDVSNDIIRLDIREKASYKVAFDGIDNKINVTKSKAIASADKDYLARMMEKEEAENAKSYWKGVYEVFTNAHIFYKLQTRE